MTKDLSLAGSFQNLENFWQTATLDLPIVIIGGGRWGRTWASVIAGVRGSGRGIILAARTDPGAAGAWAAARTDLAGLRVAANLAGALELQSRSAVAIIASRPRDHVRDAREALQAGLHVLVEKPISVDARDGRALTAEARQAGRVLAVGTEFAYLPALHQVARDIAGRGERSVKLRLTWEDVAGEFRHGATKIRHEEVGLLPDLLPHALSIFQVFAPDGALHILNASDNDSEGRGWIEFGDDAGSRYVFFCDVAAGERRRVLEIEGDAVTAALDFGGSYPSILIDGRARPLDSGLSALNSTLRLELGAFLAVTTGAISGTFITSGVPRLLALQEQLQQMIAAKGHASSNQ